MGKSKRKPAPPAPTRYQWDKTCAACGRTFKAARYDKRYCSPACQTRAYRGRRGDQRSELADRLRQLAEERGVPFEVVRDQALQVGTDQLWREWRQLEQRRRREAVGELPADD